MAKCALSSCDNEAGTKTHPKQRYCCVSHGLQGSRKIHDPNPFDLISSEWKFYLLGLLYADGCLSSNTTDADDIRVTIALKDKDLLEQLHPIYCPERKLYSQVTHSNTMSYSIINKNKTFIEQLCAFGITERKSLTTTMPLIPTRGIRHFIRGYFDGDGSVFVFRHNPRAYLGVSFTSGSRLFLESLQEILIEQIDVRFTYQADKRHHGDQIRLSRTPDIKEFYRWIYPNATIFLQRKKHVFEHNGYI